MIKKTLFVIFSLPLFAMAQMQNDATPVAKTCQWSSFVGVQSNLLIREVLNFSGANNTINNPYLLCYSINHNKSGWGASVGLGLTTTHSATSDATGSSLSSNQQIGGIRLGVEKRWYIHPKWTTAVGLDALMNFSKTTSTNKTVQGFGAGETDTNDKNNSMGAGIRGSLYYSITPRIWIGTETNLAFLMGKENSTTTTTQIISGGGSNPNATISNADSNGFTINLPMAFFVLVKF